jgi:8-oxo-dGTP diphosphatase
VHFTEYDTRLAAYALLVDDADRVLLTWFNGEGRAEPCWSLPGGGVDFDETVVDAVMREVREETGYLVEVEGLLVEHHFSRPATAQTRAFRSQRFVFEARIVGGRLGTTEVGGSTDFARWIPVAEVAGQPARADIVDVALAARGWPAP